MLQAITEPIPNHFGLPFARGSAQAVRALLWHHFRLDLQGRTVRKSLTRRGFTPPPRPLKRAYERDPQAVAHGLQEDYPKIGARAKAEGAKIQGGDETAVSSHQHFPRGYAPPGKTPVLRLVQAKRERINLLASLTNQGLWRFMLFAGCLTAVVFITLLQQLLRSTPRKVFLIVDKLRVPGSRRVAEWVAAHAERIELVFLPKGAPDLKARLHAAEPVRDGAHLRCKVLSHLHSLQKQPARLRSYFHAPAIRYAA